ncbi:hypothetical protein ACPXB3_21960, partial [Gordonia sp. DT219]
MPTGQIGRRLERTSDELMFDRIHFGRIHWGVTMTTIDLPALAPDEQVALLHALLDQMGSTDLSPCSDETLLEVAAANERAINRLTFQGDRQ